MTHLIRTTALLVLAGAGSFIGFPYYEYFKSKGLTQQTPKDTTIGSKCFSKLENLTEKAINSVSDVPNRVQPSNRPIYCKGYISCNGKNLYLYNDGTLTNTIITDADNQGIHVYPVSPSTNR